MFLSLKHTVGFFLIVTLCSASPEEYSLPSLLFTAPFEPSWPSYYTSVALAMQDINNNSTILPNTKLVLDIHSYGRKQADAIAKMIEFSDKNQTLVVGHLLSFGSVVTGIVGNVYGVAQLAVSSTSTELSDKLRYPYFSRVAPPSSGQVRSIVETVRYYAEMQGPGWDEIGIISTTDPYGVDSSETLIELAKDTRHISVQVYQQFLPDATDFDLELSETAKAGVRVIVALIISVWEEFIVAADAMGLVGDHYVWIVPDSISCCVFEDETVNRLTQGTLGVFQYIPSPEESTKVADFYERWLSLDPSIYLGTTEPPSKFTILAYDMAMVAGVVLDHLDQMGELETPRISAERMTEVIRMASFDGLSGLVTFDEEGDRISDYSVSYYSAEERRWIVAAIYSELTGSYSPVRDVVWFSNTTEVPDLDIRDPFNYWSCHDKEKKTDETGKIIQRQTPGSEDINNIDSDYYCDKFIDCWNLSDESSGCSSNYVALYIAFGIITGILLLISLMFLILVILFGLILKYRRLRAFSPLFMLIVILSIILGYLSVFAWFGKPHPVACAFQPWLLGISSVSMIAALCAKTFRIWRIFRRRMSKQKISDLELLALWILAMLPVILILTVWAIVSTPTASLEKRDGKEHYICTTGGFTGEPGGLIFFIILIVYAAIVLSIGVFLSIVTRSVPSRFNESKLLAISIYNLGFLSIVVIPVFMVIQPFDPFIAWILRTCAILYAFTAVLVLQCVPPFVAILVFDRCSNVRVFKSSLKFNNSNSPMTNSSPSAVDTSN